MTTTTAVTMYSLSLYPAIDTTIYVERFEPVRELIATDEHSEAGGKGANVSAALGEMGIACPCIALVGRENAEIYLKKLRSIGVQYIPLFAEGRIRENLSLETPAGQFRIMRRGFAADAGTLPQLERVLAAVLSPGTWYSLEANCRRASGRPNWPGSVRRSAACRPRWCWILHRCSRKTFRVLLRY